ncbi:MAG: hypothetical protein GJ680_05460 [Alteromonadaceae bacterium]|nr:hypothetical protein [Alteromonadaceae bacterium]
MSLLTLKRKASVPEKRKVDFDEFIEQAKDVYTGNLPVINNVISIDGSNVEVLEVTSSANKMSRHCFTLDKQAREQLFKLAQEKQISRSALIRELLKQPSK